MVSINISKCVSNFCSFEGCAGDQTGVGEADWRGGKGESGVVEGEKEYAAG